MTDRTLTSDELVNAQKDLARDLVSDGKRRLQEEQQKRSPFAYVEHDPDKCPCWDCTRKQLRF